jgi:hypothetical protein
VRLSASVHELAERSVTPSGASRLARRASELGIVRKRTALDWGNYCPRASLVSSSGRGAEGIGPWPPGRRPRSPTGQTDTRRRPPRSVAGCRSCAGKTRHTGAGAASLAGFSCRYPRTGDAAPVQAASASDPRRRPWHPDRARRGAGPDGAAHATLTQPKITPAAGIAPAETNPAARVPGDQRNRELQPGLRGCERRRLSADRFGRAARPPSTAAAPRNHPQIGDSAELRGSAAAAQPAARPRLGVSRVATGFAARRARTATTCHRTEDSGTPDAEPAAGRAAP